MSQAYAHAQQQAMTALAKRIGGIPTNDLRLLLVNAETNGFGTKPHALAYRAELEKRNVLCVNCGEQYARAVPCFNHCEQCIPRNEAVKIHTLADLREYQRGCGADV